MKFIQLLAIVATVALQVRASPARNVAGKRVVCYFGSWAVYRYGNAKITPEQINPGLCTHFIYTFIGLDESTNSVKYLDPWLDYGDEWKQGLVKQLCTRARSQNTKCMIALGGWNEGSLKYSQVACNPARRAQLVRSITTFVENNQLDGFDLDWEYPGERGGNEGDRECFTALVTELATEFKKHDWELSAAVSANELLLNHIYDVPAISQQLSFINIMAYDLHGSWEPYTGHNAPLYGDPSEPKENAHLNVNRAVRAWMNLGAPASKLNLGVGTYGRSFTLVNQNNHGVRAPAGGTPPSGWVPENGFYGFNEICANNGSVWTTAWDSNQQVPYAWSGSNWVGYDDLASIKLKTCYAKSLNLGGMMVWTVETDDFNGNCGKGKYPLINTIISSLQDSTCGSSNQPLPSTESPGTEPPQTQAPPLSITEVVTSTPPIVEVTTEVPTTSSGNGNQEGLEPSPEVDNPSQDKTEPSTDAPVPNDNFNEVPFVPVCESIGQRIRNKNSCSSFWYCTYGNQGILVPTQINCAQGLVYDPQIQVCNFRSASTTC